MKKQFVPLVLAITAMIAAGCATDSTMSNNNSARKHFNSWIKVNYPNAPRTDLGVYILEDEEGTGVTVGDEDTHPYVYFDYQIYDLDGVISAYTDASTAKQLHEYDSTKYYGPKPTMRLYDGMTVGLEEAMAGMKVGGRRKIAIPGWLNTTTRYSDEDDYLANSSGTDVIVNMTLTDAVEDLIQFQIDSIETYMERNLHKVDSTMWGFYYIQTCPPTDTTSFSSGDVVYFNYTGQLLNGLVFDTSLKNVAKQHGLYDSTKEYTDSRVTLAEDYEDYAMDGGDEGNMINGFAYCLSLMKAGEKGIAIFTSDIAYDYQSTDQIPAYAPLRFDIEMIGKK